MKLVVSQAEANKLTEAEIRILRRLSAQISLVPLMQLAAGASERRAGETKVCPDREWAPALSFA